MKKPLRVLLVEDCETDAELLIARLRRHGYEPTWERVQTRDELADALGRGPWDIVLTDYSMPDFSGLDAIDLVQKQRAELPIIVVSGTVGEEVAVEAMRHGAHDFLIKDRLHRLVPVIERELRDAAMRRERVKMREQLVISERLASVGVLAAGVAHEINNPLAVVVTSLEILDRELGRISKNPTRASAGGALDILSEQVRIANEGAERVRAITRDLKVFSRTSGEAGERSVPIDVRLVMDSSIRIAAAEIRHRARMVKAYDAVPPVLADEGRLGQVFLNLLVNAAQSIEAGAVADNEIRISAFAGPRKEVIMEVRDTGCGIPKDELGQVFDVFFTTKPVGIGTGLGLAICHRIIADLGGSIEVESALGAGSCFRVVLPMAKDTVQAIEAIPASLPYSARRARVLVIDDEVALARSIARLLSDEHDVEPIGSARAALSRITRGERFDVILCDLIMPELTGMQFFDELTVASPEQASAVVFTSGGTFTPASRTFVERAQRPCLDKPFDLRLLRATVRETIERRSSS